MGTRGQWARDLAAALGNAQPDAPTISWIAAWTKAENTRARYNPLATTQTWPGATNFNAVGVKNYASREDGIAATVQTLSYGFPGYDDIREGIRTNDPERAMRGLYRAPWGTNGALVERIWRSGDVSGEALLAEAGAPPPPPPQPNPPPPAPSIEPEHGPGGGMPDALGGPDEDLVRTLALAGLGGVLMLIALVMAMRRFIPTETLVRTAVDAAVPG